MLKEIMEKLAGINTFNGTVNIINASPGATLAFKDESKRMNLTDFRQEQEQLDWDRHSRNNARLEGYY